MADGAASRAMLVDMGCTEPAANAIREDQGMENMEDWAQLDYGDLKSLLSIYHA